jgi:hypothetical protein
MAALSLKEFYHKYGTGVPNSWEQCEQIWNAATKYADENCHSLQQLKAEIAALIPSVELCRNIFNINKVNDLLNKMRQLSDV